MMTFKELWEEIKEPVFSLIPGLLTVWGMTPSLVFLIPGILKIVSQILEWILGRAIHVNLEKEYDASIEIHKVNERKHSNHLYRVISWYIIKGINDGSLCVRRLVCNETTIQEDDSEYFSRDESIHSADYTIVPDEDYFIDIPYNGTKFRAHHYKFGQKNDNFALKIYADRIEDLKEFEENCLREHRQFCMERGQDSYKYFEWNLEDSEWCKSDIETLKKWENIFIPVAQKQDLKKKLDTFRSSKEKYQQWGIPYKLGLVFHGVPGCGKTSTIYAIANYLERNIYFLKLDIFKTNQELLKAARDIPKDAIVVLEDIDAHQITHQRIIPKIQRRNDRESYSAARNTSLSSDESDGDYDTDAEDNAEIARISRIAAKLAPDLSPSLGSGKTIDSLLEIFDGYNYLPGAVVIITTNHIDKLDSALIRPGRMDHHYHFNYANLDTINEILKFFFSTSCNDGNDSDDSDGSDGNDSDDSDGSDGNDSDGSPQSGGLQFDLRLDGADLNKITTSEVINSIVLPNIDTPEKAAHELKQRLRFTIEDQDLQDQDLNSYQSASEST